MNKSTEACRAARAATKDTSVPASGVKKSARVELGLQLLSLAAIPGDRFTAFEIAAWCGCTRDAILRIEERALRKLANSLKFGPCRRLGAELGTARIGAADRTIDPEAMRKAAAKFRPVEMPKPAEARQIAAKSARQSHMGRWGCKGMPEHIWRAMYAEYCTGKSCQEVAAIFGGTRQSVHEVFHVRRLKLRPRHPRLLAKIEYLGVSYTPGKSEYYRGTSGDRLLLHHVMWEDAHGPIPAGWQVTFKNADHTDLRLDNMQCMPIADVTRYHLERHRAAQSAAA